MVYVKGHKRKISAVNTSKRIRTYLQKSKEEFKKYQSIHQEVYLAQAGEKLWNAYNMIIEQISNKRLRKFEAVKMETLNLNDELVSEVFNILYSLHVFFYRGWTEDMTIEENKYRKSLYLLAAIMEKYKIN